MNRNDWRGLTLQQGERLIAETKASFVPWLFLYGALLFVVSIAILYFGYFETTMTLQTILIVPVIVVAHYFIHQQYRWALTNHRVIQKWGIFVTRKKSALHNRSTNIKVIRPLLTHIVGNGRVRISTAGSEGYQIEIFGLHHPYDVESGISNTANSFEGNERRGKDPTYTSKNM